LLRPQSATKVSEITKELKGSSMIENVDQYESVMRVINLLRKVGMALSVVLHAVSSVEDAHGDEFERCSDCGGPLVECTCGPTYERYYIEDDWREER
jgi:hypothetical protein